MNVCLVSWPAPSTICVWSHARIAARILFAPTCHLTCWILTAGFGNGRLLIYSDCVLLCVWSDMISTQWLGIYTDSGLKCPTSTCRLHESGCSKDWRVTSFRPVANMRVFFLIQAFDREQTCVCSFSVRLYVSYMEEPSHIVKGGSLIKWLSCC